MCRRVGGARRRGNCNRRFQSSPVGRRLPFDALQKACYFQGSLYPALQRLKRQGLAKARWQVTANGRRARYYELTSKGTTRLADQQAQWSRTSGAVNRVLAAEKARA